MIVEFLLTGLLLPLILIGLTVGLERVEEDLDRVAPRRPPPQPAVDEREEAERGPT